MKCDFCREREVEPSNPNVEGFIIESNGRRPLCRFCAIAVYKACVEMILQRWHL